MQFVIRANFRDSVTIEALVAARGHREMAAFVGSALSHYVRTPEGKKTLAYLTKNGAPSDIVEAPSVTKTPTARAKVAKVVKNTKAPVAVKPSSESPRPGVPRTMDDFLKG